jgi:hypothetical protein
MKAAWLAGGLAAGLLLTAGPALAAPVCTPSGGTMTCVFSYSGSEQTFTVPAGVTSLHVVAIGGHGAAGGAGEAGGNGAMVTADLTSSEGTVLYVEVGGDGSAGGFNGGGAAGTGTSYGNGGGGGGASDVRSVSSSSSGTLSSRLLVAAGGGGGGGNGGYGAGGDAGNAGGNAYSGEAGGGGAGTSSAGGGGGAGVYGAGSGQPGQLGSGGAGGSSGTYAGGGGGGGGFYGGGGGGGGGGSAGVLCSGCGGGGGGGSNLVPAGGSAAVSGSAAEVTISYAVAVASAAPPANTMVCLAGPHVRSDGTTGRFFQVTRAQWVAGAADPSSIYYQSTPAIYVQGYGAMCELSDVASYGGDPATFSDSGTTVDGAGHTAPVGDSPADWGAIYEYYTASG